MITVLDVECTSKGNPSPYNTDNYLVSVGYKADGIEEYLCFKHDEEPMTQSAFYILQNQLDVTSLLVGHNIKFDLSWLLECGFKYPRAIHDTMIFEFIKVGGDPSKRMNLSASCERYGLPTKQDVAGELFRKGTGFESMPWDIVESYGRNDVDITWMLYHKQMEELEWGNLNLSMMRNMM